MKIYTKGGDLGETTSCNGGRVLKNHVVVEANGAVDECNSCIGIVTAAVSNEAGLQKSLQELQSIQHLLFDLGAEIYAIGDQKETRASKKRISQEAVLNLEAWIDHLDKQLPALTQFILPSGPYASAWLHHARSVSRRAERRLVAMHQEFPIREEALAFINRLSDYLFVLSRYFCQYFGAEETCWRN